MKKLLLLALACAATLPAAHAQTGRVAHFSHGGSAGTLATASRHHDNFGEYVYYSADSVRYVSPKKVVRYGVWSYYNSPRTIDTLNLEESLTAVAALRYLRENRYLLRHDNQPVKFIGFDSVSGSGPLPVPQREPARKQRRQKASVLLPAAPPGTGGAMLLLAALAGAGWLLAGRQPQTRYAA